MQVTLPIFTLLLELASISTCYPVVHSSSQDTLNSPRRTTDINSEVSISSSPQANSPSPSPWQQSPSRTTRPGPALRKLPHHPELVRSFSQNQASAERQSTLSQKEAESQSHRSSKTVNPGSAIRKLPHHSEMVRSMDQIQAKKERASGSSAKVLQRLNSTKSQAKVHRFVGKDTDGVLVDQVKKSADSAKRVPQSGKALFGVPREESPKDKSDAVINAPALTKSKSAKERVSHGFKAAATVLLGIPARAVTHLVKGIAAPLGRLKAKIHLGGSGGGGDSDAETRGKVKKGRSSVSR